MAEGQVQTRIQAVVMTYFPMFIAALSLCTSIYNGYLNNKFVDLIQNNTARVESLRTCKEIIDAYFQVKFRVGVISSDAERTGTVDGGNDDRSEQCGQQVRVGHLSRQSARPGHPRALHAPHPGA
jgi:hypothetical protein